MKITTLLQILFIQSILYSSYKNYNKQTSENQKLEQEIKFSINEKKLETDSFPKTFDRLSIVENLNQKKLNKESFLTHIFVPLCDNEHQNIVGTNKRLAMV